MSVLSFTGEYRWLSNFWPTTILGPGNYYYPSVEHAYQASKSLDPKDWESVLPTTVKAATAKRLGKTFTLRYDWEQIKLEIMKNLLEQKFRRGTRLADLLRATEGELVEGNWWGDTFWGVCRGKGENHLGRLLMEIREELRRTGA